MKLWLVLDYARWGFSHNVVRAETREAAIQLAGAHPTSDKVEVTELSIDGEPSVLWCHDESPDTGPE